MQHDYDEIYDTKISRPYGNSKIGFIFGPLLFFLGVVSLVMSITDLYRGIYDLNSNPSFVMTWDENPIWPSYGKGFWVGLIFIAAGVIGIISSCEHTIASIYAFAALSAVSAALGFYLLISAIVSVQKLAGVNRSDLATKENNTLGLNSVLMAMGGLALLVGTAASILSCMLVGCCTERRGYGAGYLDALRNPLHVGGRNPAYEQ